MAFNGRLPENEEGLRALVDSLRHQGHIAESPQAGSNSWTGSRGGQHHFADGSPECLFGTDMSNGGDVSLAHDMYVLGLLRRSSLRAPAAHLLR